MADTTVNGDAKRPGVHPGWWWFIVPALLFGLSCPAEVMGQEFLSATPDSTPHSDARLVSEVTSIRPGETFTVALVIDLDDGWHTYWRNPGDAGTAAVLDWALPQGFEAGPVQWPAPERVPVPPLMSYAYTGRVMLLTDITAPATAASGAWVHVGLSAEFLVCQEICLPAEVVLGVDLPVSQDGGKPDPAWKKAFAATRDRLPMEGSGWQAHAVTTTEGYDLVVDPPAGQDAGSTTVYFFVLDPTALEHATPQVPVWQDGAMHIALTRSAYNTGPSELDGVLVRTDGGGFDQARRRPAVALTVPVEGVATAAAGGEEGAPSSSAGTAGREAGAATSTPGTAGASAQGSAHVPPLRLTLALVLAFAGGLLLNLMPCVFPVLSLKILSFVRHADGDERRTRLHGLAFGAGVVLSFLVLAGTLLGVRAAGAQVGWGFQLQSPGVVAALSVLLFVIGLGFAGVMTAGASLTRLAGVGSGDERYRGSFLTGVLATIVATPCTAPFMGAAVGAALVRPATESMAIFGVLGLGMATPYTVLSSWPALLRHVPRPGPWMESLKQALAFPMFAVTAWLVWVFGLETGMGGVAALLACLILIGFAAWLVGRWPAATTRGGALVTSRVLAGVAVVMAVVAVARGVRAAPTGTESRSESVAMSGGWEPFGDGVVEDHRREGRAVFVDFTAAWCISCQVNERFVLSSDQVMDAFQAVNVALVKADWTRRDPAITRALASFGRSGVPLYVLYPPDSAAEPELLPAVLTTGIVLDALGRLDTPGSAYLTAGRSNGGP
ncbi:MAG: thioredoxin family protein [Gemmatimonadetes bacterium]|nr:thioredoxin family protein [Gemmatimonadota bacterium]